MLGKKRTSTGRKSLYLFLLIVTALTGCSGIHLEHSLTVEYAAYSQSVFISDKSTDQIQAAFIKTAASKPFELQSTIFSNDLRTEILHYKGKSVGIWPFDKCCWDEIIWFGMKIGELPKAKKKIVIYAHARQRQNSNWPFEPVDSFDRAAPYFNTFSNIFKNHIGL